MENFDLSAITDEIGKVFNDLPGFGEVLKAIVDAFIKIGELFKTF